MKPIVEIYEDSDTHICCDFCQEFGVPLILISGQLTSATGSLVKSSANEEYVYTCHACSLLLVQAIQDSWTDKLLGLKEE